MWPKGLSSFVASREENVNLVSSDSLSCLSFLFKIFKKNLNFVNYFPLGSFLFCSDELGWNFKSFFFLMLNFYEKLTEIIWKDACYY